MANLKKIVNDTLDFCNEKLKAADIALKINVPEDINIKCRPLQISQIFLNLINNFYDAIKDSKQSKWIEISVQKDGGKYNIAVIDSGTGISKEFQEKLFQPFFTNKRVGTGTGMGLSIAKGIMGEHGGEISYNNQYPNTCFVMQLNATS